MKNLKDIISEKLKVSNKSSIAFDDIEPIGFSEEIFKEVSHILYKSGFQNAFKYYELKNIYGDDLPSFYRSSSFADENSKCYGLFGDFDSTKPNISLVFNGHNNEMYSTPFNKIKNFTLFLSLGKGDVCKGMGVLKYIADELK